jgi:type VI secretion system protein VasG
MSTRASPKALIRRMTPTFQGLLEAAVVRAADARHDEVTVEHVLEQMARSPDGDVAAIHEHVECDELEGLQERLEVLVKGMPAGSRAKPVLAPRMLEWLEDGWLYGSLEHGATRLRSGHAFYLLVRHPRRYFAGFVSEVEAIDADALERALPIALQATREDDESRASPSSAFASLERQLAVAALRRGASAVAGLEAFRARAYRDAQEARTWVELFTAALEPEGDRASPDAIARMASVVDETAAALRGDATARAPLRLVRDDDPNPSV